MKLSKKLQKLFAMLLVAVMVVSVLPVGSLSVFADTGEFAGGDGTEENPYLIANKEQLNNVRNYLSANFKLIADIEFTDADFEEGGDFYNDGAGFEPIGVYSYPFTGTFDGDGHVVKNLYVNIESDRNVYAGLFAYNQGVIKNLGMVDGNVTAISSDSSGDAYAYAGGIAGYNEGTIENCYNTGDVAASSSSSYSSSSSSSAVAFAGGIVGYNNDGTITNCYNISSISASASSTSFFSLYNSYSYAGGIAGFNNGAIYNCYNTGNVAASTSYSHAYAGGIVGENGEPYDGGTIENCYNTGNIVSNGSCAGGIVGNNYKGAVENCYNTGNVSTDSSYYVGGIAGDNEGTITNCYNTGDVSDGYYAGGIAGFNDGTITNCYNTGSVSAYSDGSAYAGGIAGFNDYGIITNCYNTGDVSFSFSFYAYAGGIVGYNDYGTITNCYNTGEVSADADDYSYAGGIAGENDEGTIENCYNTGIVSANSDYSDAYAGGIVGLNSTYSTITTCYNIGNVSAEASSDDCVTYIGGIAGDSVEGTVTNCYYADKISKGVGNGYDVTQKCTVEQLKNQDTFKNFDFETVWTMDNEVGYPYPVLKGVDTVEVLIYNIDGDYIFGVRAGTKVSALVDGIADCKIYNGEDELGDDDLVGTGMVVKIIDGDTVKATYTLVVAGDINGSGKIDSADYLLIKRAAFGTFTLTDAMKLAGDINGDTLINSADYLLVKRACFGTYKI